MKQRYCPYFRYGQCTVAPKNVATVVVEKRRCSGEWWSCSFYIRRNKTKNDSPTVKNNGTLERYVEQAKTVVPEVDIPSACPMLKRGTCLVRGRTLTTIELTTCINHWRECPDRRRASNRDEEGIESKIMNVLDSILHES